MRAPTYLIGDSVYNMLPDRSVQDCLQIEDSSLIPTQSIRSHVGGKDVQARLPLKWGRLFKSGDSFTWPKVSAMR